MNIKEIIPKLADSRDEIKAAIEESETDVPHLCNAAGALQLAIRNLEGHLQKQAELAAAKAAVEKQEQ